MIFVTVGTPKQPFDRLVRVVDDLAAQIDERVVVQIGTATYEPQYAEYFRWATSQEMEKLTEEARIVISQASAGAIILATKYQKPFVIVPRLSQYGEHFNDHQSQLAKALLERGQAIILENFTADGLKEAIHCALELKVIHSNRENLIAGLKSQLDTWQLLGKDRKRSRESTQ